MCIRDSLENLKEFEARNNYVFIKADICDSETISNIFEEYDIDRVVHFAAESHVDRSIKNPDVFVKTNVLGTLVMLSLIHILAFVLNAFFVVFPGV